MTRLSDDEFASIWRTHGNATRVAAATGMAERSVNGRRNSLRKKGFDLPTIAQPGYESRAQYQPEDGWTFPPERHVWLDTGTLISFSDAHFWPGKRSIANEALLKVIKAVKPRVVVANGDIFDGGSIGRHPPFGFAKRPSPVEELHACQERMGEIEQAVPRGCELLFTVGNHDVRWERTLAAQAKEFAELRGMRLEHHFPAWEFYWSAFVNWESRDPVVVYHDHCSGVHAGYNNTLKAGVTTVTGHTHQLAVTPYVDLRGRRYGIQDGSLADLAGPQFEYQRRRPSLACPGFAVLTFRDGLLLPPELCQVIDGKAIFRGEYIA